MVGTELSKEQLRRAAAALKALIVTLTFAAVGVLLGTTVTSPDWKRAITYSGMGIYVVTLLLNPLLGFLFWIATSPFGRFVYLNISLGASIPDLSLDRLAAALVIILLLAPLAIRKRTWASLSVVDLMVVLFIIGTGISLPFALAGPRATAQAYFDTQIVPLVVYFAAKNLIVGRSKTKAATTTLLFIAAYMSFLVIREQLTGEILFYPEGRTIAYTAHLRRAVGLLGNPAFFAMIFGMALPFAFRAFINARSPLGKVLYLTLIGVTIYALYLCYNRAGYVGALLGLIVMSLFYPEFRRRFVPLVLIAGILIAYFWGQISESYIFTERVTAQGPIDYRLNAINVARQMVAESPLFGRGYGNFGYIYSDYASDWTQQNVLPAPHNSYINILVSSGLAGFIPYVGIFAAIFFQGLRLWRSGARIHAIDRPLLACMMAATAVYTATIFFSDIVAVPYVTMVYFFIVGLTLGSQERASRWGDAEAWLP